MEINVKGKEDKEQVWIEEITSGNGLYVMSSNLVEPTQEEVDEFFRKECDHVHNRKQLIYDEPSFMYDFRYCAVCGKSLGTV